MEHKGVESTWCPELASDPPRLKYAHGIVGPQGDGLAASPGCSACVLLGKDDWRRRYHGLTFIQKYIN